MTQLTLTTARCATLATILALGAATASHAEDVTVSVTEIEADHMPLDPRYFDPDWTDRFDVKRLYANASAVNLPIYTEPDKLVAGVIGLMEPGDAGRLEACFEDWCRVNFEGDLPTGWVEMIAMQPVPGTDTSDLATLPLNGVSWGGNLREGPGTEYAIVGRTNEGQPLTVVASAGGDFNGFPWFAVTDDTGKNAYIWGGILCVPNATLAGTFTGTGCPG